MGHDQLFDTLLLLGLRGLSMLLYWVWPRGRPATCLTTPAPIKQRSTAPQSFAGLIHKPLRDACEHAGACRPQIPCAPPPALTGSRGRRRTIDIQHHGCLDQECAYYGWTGHGNIRANRHPGGKPWRQLPCVSCHGFFQETHGTPF